MTLKYHSALLKQTPAKIVKMTRASQDLSQAAMAHKLGVTRSVISRYETGEYMPPSDVLVKCLRLLGIDLVELVADDLEERNDAVTKAVKMMARLTSQGNPYPGMEDVLALGLRNTTREKLNLILKDLRVQLEIE